MLSLMSLYMLIPLLDAMHGFEERRFRLPMQLRRPCLLSRGPFSALPLFVVEQISYRCLLCVCAHTDQGYLYTTRCLSLSSLIGIHRSSWQVFDNTPVITRNFCHTQKNFVAFLCLNEQPSQDLPRIFPALSWK